MSEKTIIGLSRMMALQKAVDVLANNVANQRTTGYKATGIRFQEYLSTEKPDDDGSGIRTRTSMVDVATFIDLSSGTLKATGDPLNVAIAGDGYFVVRTADGERYTRNGAFSIDPSGRLVTNSQQIVTTVSGEPVPPNSGIPSIGVDGTVSVGGKAIDRLRLVRFSEPNRLSAAAGNLFESSQSPIEVPANSIRLVQGALEQSNVSTVMETSRMIEYERAYQLVASVTMKDDGNDELERLAGLK